MKFKIEQYHTKWNYFWKQQLVYLPEESSFYIDTKPYKVDLELTINKISLSVSTEIIIDVGGFCGLGKNMLSNFKTPAFEKGFLRLVEHLDLGLAYGINDVDWPVHINHSSGWVCIGDTNKTGTGVEFIKNCAAILNKNGEIVSLWLKPLKLPASLTL